MKVLHQKFPLFQFVNQRRYSCEFILFAVACQQTSVTCDSSAAFAGISQGIKSTAIC